MRALQDLTTEELRAAVGQKEVTFQPLARRRFRCNQLPKFGALTQAQIRALRGRVWQIQQKVEISRTPAEILLEVITDTLGWVRCPHCKQWNIKKDAGRTKCEACQEAFLVKQATFPPKWSW